MSLSHPSSLGTIAFTLALGHVKARHIVEMRYQNWDVPVFPGNDCNTPLLEFMSNYKAIYHSAETLFCRQTQLGHS